MASSSKDKVDISSTSQNSFHSDNGSMVKPPKFNANNFSLWKSRMMLFLEGIDSRYLIVLREGPLVPKERNSATGRCILKTEKDHTEEDRRTIGLDSKVRAIISQSLPDEVYHSLVNFSTAKEMWSTLCVLYEGTDERERESHDDIDHSSEAYLSEADDEGEDTYVDQMTEEMSMLANFSKFRKNPSSIQFRGKNFRYISTCRSHPQKSSPSSSFKELSNKVDKYKAKYKREKERNFNCHRKGKGLLAETLDWADEPTSDSEKEVSSKCLMEKLDEEVKDSISRMDFSAECSSSSSQRLQKEQGIESKWNTSSKNLENIFKDQVIGDEKFGLGYWKEDADYTPSEDIPSPSQNPPLSSKLPSYSPEWIDTDSGDSNSVYSMDLRDSRKFGIFVSAKQSKPILKEDQNSNDFVKPVNDLLKTLNLKECSSSSSYSSSSPPPPKKSPLLNK
ncbi:hypothetical protein L6452_19492 [Arctium lappa]|uniref:Uncharacterized protein n=1 Tax=Arctium lappa TaxID=4217 RepID=A0ACB9B9K8_ARCLA|nr:hypothetical protein L6452_19492 [Arctium lappa]